MDTLDNRVIIQIKDCKIAHFLSRDIHFTKEMIVFKLYGHIESMYQYQSTAKFIKHGFNLRAIWAVNANFFSFATIFYF